MTLMVSNIGYSPSQPVSNSWNGSLAKRLFDISIATVALLLTLPITLLAALVIKFTSSGPVFFRQIRLGKDGREFRLLKFRTMRHAPTADGPRVTRSGDPRVSKVGAVLRKWKIDELPQLLNVIQSEMSLVGPRPDVAEYLRTLNPAEKEILRLSPGITGAASLRYRNEEELLSSVQPEDLQHYYCTKVLPDKVRIDLEYARNAGLLSDLAILVRSLIAIGGSGRNDRFI
jgi:lipopolysaccharide/colanic/teichoic acid biosynthesis glycosyltransferase